MPPTGNIFTLLKDINTMLLPPLEDIIEASIEDAATMLEFGPCDKPGVGIIVPMGEELIKLRILLAVIIHSCSSKEIR